MWRSRAVVYVRASREVNQLVDKGSLEVEPDKKGSLVSVVRMDAHLSYIGVPDLLRAVIDKHDKQAWTEIRRKLSLIHI